MLRKLLRRLFEKEVAVIRGEERDKALADVVRTFIEADKIYTKPVTLVGESPVITDCIFMGVPGLEVDRKGEK